MWSLRNRLNIFADEIWNLNKDFFLYPRFTEERLDKEDSRLETSDFVSSSRKEEKRWKGRKHDEPKRENGNEVLCAMLERAPEYEMMMIRQHQFSMNRRIIFSQVVAFELLGVCEKVFNFITEKQLRSKKLVLLLLILFLHRPSRRYVDCWFNFFFSLPTYRLTSCRGGGSVEETREI